nr:U1 small nuclear ribonucleoprotein 70 kDa [Ipomoea batatas]
MGDHNDAFMRNNNSAAVQARAKAQNRSNIVQLKLIGQSHPTGLTANLLKLFEPRPPLEFKPPPEKRKCLPYTGMAQFVSNFAEPGDPEYAPPIKEVETRAQRRARVHNIRLEEGAKKVAEELEKHDPNNDPNASGDPYKTLFVARLNYETTENRIKREFEAYGPIKRVRLVTDKNNNKPRGYAFIEYVHTRDMKAAYKQADGKKIDNRRVLVDVERGRTVPNWRPRCLGGGLGTTRVGNEDLNQRELVQSGGKAQSEEPRIRDDRDREKSRERGRDREREQEKSRERSHERPKDRDYRDERHKDRDRNRDYERDHGRDRDRERDRTRGRDHGRERDRGRDHDRNREKDRGRSRDYDVDEHEHGYSRDRDYDYDHERGYSRNRDDYDHEHSYYHDRDYDHERDRHDERDRKYDHGETEEDRVWYEQSNHGHKHSKGEHDRGHYDYYDHHKDHGEYDNPDGQGYDESYKD